MILYNIKSTPTGYRITKWDQDLNPESSYDLAPVPFPINMGCSCPQGHKPTCRHRKMLDIFLRPNLSPDGSQGASRVDTGWFFNYDTRQWHQAVHEPTAVAIERNMSIDIQDGSDHIPALKIGYMTTTDQFEGEGPVPSTLAANQRTSPSASGRGQPSPEPMKRRI